jgi:thiol-disulfide isomerase/thioredoxin
MPRLFAAYLRVDPAKAVAFAREMQGGENAKEWEGQLAMAQAYVEANDRLREGKAADALGLLDKLTVEKRWLSVDGVFSNGPMLVRFKAKVLARAGRAQDAYDSLLRQETSWPEDETRTALLDTGKLMGKTPVQVDADLKAALAAGSRPAPALALTEYGTGETVSLDKLRGKVVLLTFWFPGCGPCRSEMPHFEAVMKELRGKDIAFLGVNGLREQDPYVPSFMKGTGFSFTPLQGTDAVTAPAAYNVRAYPTNFIIDRSGRIVYSGFMIHDAEGEQTLKRMLESLL